MSNPAVILKWQSKEYNSKFAKRPLLFRSEISTFDIFFERLHEEIFEDLQIISNGKFQIRATISHKMTDL